MQMNRIKNDRFKVKTLILNLTTQSTREPSFQIIVQREPISKTKTKQKLAMLKQECHTSKCIGMKKVKSKHKQIRVSKHYVYVWSRRRSLCYTCGLQLLEREEETWKQKVVSYDQHHKHTHKECVCVCVCVCVQKGYKDGALSTAIDNLTLPVLL